MIGVSPLGRTGLDSTSIWDLSQGYFLLSLLFYRGYLIKILFSKKKGVPHSLFYKPIRTSIQFSLLPLLGSGRVGEVKVGAKRVLRVAQNVPDCTHVAVCSNIFLVCLARDFRQECHPISSGDGRFPALAKSCSTPSMESYEMWHSLLKVLNIKSAGFPLWSKVKTRKRLIPSLGSLWSAKYIRDFAPSEKVSFFPSAIHIVTCRQWIKKPYQVAVTQRQDVVDTKRPPPGGGGIEILRHSGIRHSAFRHSGIPAFRFRFPAFPLAFPHFFTF